MKPYYQDPSFTLFHGDCLSILESLPSDSVDSVVTDPPYGLRFMGKRWDYDVPSAAIWAECLRVLKPGGHLLAFAGTRTQHRMAVRIEDAGFEIRDMIAWVYGSGFPKSLDVSKALDSRANAKREVIGIHKRHGGGSAISGSMAGPLGTDSEIPKTAPATEAAKTWEGWGTALKPSLEPVTLARKPLIGTVAENVLTHGTGGINVDGCRVEGIPPSVPQPKFNSPTGKIYGFKAGEGRNGEMSQAAGRWPANLIHDGSDEVTGLFPETKSGKPGIMRNGQNNGFAYGAESRKPGTIMSGFGDEGSAARFFYCAKASKEDRDEGLRLAAASAGEMTGGRAEGSAGLNNPRAGAGRTSGGKNIHPTVKPTDLMQYLCRLVTPPGGVVLDPFMGSGSTGKAALLEEFRFIGCEREAAYIDIAKGRILSARSERVAAKHIELQRSLF